MKTYVSSALAVCTSLMLFNAQAAEQDWQSSASVTVISDYQFRGISQTDESMALQGAMGLEHSSGWYAGFWASNVTFGEGSMEIDIFGGYSGELENGLGYNVGFMRYQYPQGDRNGAGQSFNEYYASVSYADVTLGLTWSPDYFGGAVEEYTYVYASYQKEVWQNLTLQLHAGSNRFEDSQELAAFLGGDLPDTSNYLDWRVSLVYALPQQFELSLSYVDTDIAKEACTDLCDARVIVGLTRNF